MYIAVLDNYKNALQKFKYLIFAATWLSGFGCSVIVFQPAESIYASLMRNASFSNVSIVVLLANVILPFLITAFAVYYSKPILIFPLCFSKAFLYGLTLLSVYSTFGKAGWLMQMLLLSTDNVSVFLLCILWIRILSGKKQRLSCVMFSLTFAACLAGMIDMMIISPFVESLICV